MHVCPFFLLRASPSGIMRVKRNPRLPLISNSLPRFQEYCKIKYRTLETDVTQCPLKSTTQINELHGTSPAGKQVLQENPHSLAEATPMGNSIYLPLVRVIGHSQLQTAKLQHTSQTNSPSSPERCGPIAFTFPPTTPTFPPFPPRIFHPPFFDCVAAFAFHANFLPLSAVLRDGE